MQLLVLLLKSINTTQGLTLRLKRSRDIFICATSFARSFQDSGLKIKLSVLSCVISFRQHRFCNFVTIAIAINLPYDEKKMFGSRWFLSCCYQLQQSIKLSGRKRSHVTFQSFVNDIKTRLSIRSWILYDIFMEKIFIQKTYNYLSRRNCTKEDINSPLVLVS